MYLGVGGKGGGAKSSGQTKDTFAQEKLYRNDFHGRKQSDFIRGGIKKERQTQIKKEKKT